MYYEGEETGTRVAPERTISHRSVPLFLFRGKFDMGVGSMNKLTYDQAYFINVWLRHNEYDPHNMTLRQTIDSARQMSEWFRHHFQHYPASYLAAGILALQNGGEC
jgi:hypothetical protein